jgi:hypothetical protein
MKATANSTSQNYQSRWLQTTVFKRILKYPAKYKCLVISCISSGMLRESYWSATGNPEHGQKNTKRTTVEKSSLQTLPLQEMTPLQARF